ncbi:hypothetical protein K466DRAFT_606280 [Polyporus arcularius HHB13444]|uniref:Uncharacterized protein n=1 Tax=Polyporus arcularius HHB13444 TaxID=1314778 RepID=A0A5C3NRS2_9APHY|nr:hypothetical protein K466DRAFT_606280 [Polyporus arcularius HHB13444]
MSFSFFGFLDDEEEEDDGAEILALLSEFNAQELDTYGLCTLATYELKLRKKKDSRTKKDHLRGQSEINKLRDLGERKARKYNHNYDQLATLRALLKQLASEDDMEGRLRKIDLHKDLEMVSLTVSKSVGDDKRRQARRKGKARAGLDSKDNTESHASTWASKADCAHWHRARMAKAQADAHVNLTCADFRAAICGLDCMSTCWNDVAERADSDLLDGARAYAYQQVHMYIKMRDELKATYAKALKPGADPEALDHHLPLRDDLLPLVKNIDAYEEMMELLHMD